MKKIILVMACFFALQHISFSQNKLNIEDVKQVNLRNSGEIMDGEELRGYFVFYVSDKVDRKTNEYTIQIMDNNLNKVKDIKFEDDKNIQILESSYNSSGIIFLFYNRKEKLLEYRIYGFNGNVLSTYTKELDKRTMYLIESTYGKNTEEGQNQAVFNVGDKGFTTVIPVKEGKYYSYEVNFFFTDRKKQWVFEAAEEQEDKIVSAIYLGNTDSLVLYEVSKKKNMTTNKVRIGIIAFNIYTGKKQFEMETAEEDYMFYPMNIVPLSGKQEFMLLGTYYEADSKISKDASLGLAAWNINFNGKVVNKKYNSWEGPISKYLPADKKGRVADVGYIYFHRVLQMEDGKIFAIGEGYKKVVSGMGVAAAILSGGRNINELMKLKITDMVMMQFDDRFDIKNAQIYDKNSNSLDIFAYSTYMSPHTMALITKAIGGFDYDFTQTDNKHSRFTVGYSDYVRNDDYKGKTFNTITYNEGKITTDKINLTSKAKWMRIFPAKSGSVMLMEYFKKEKKMEMRLEKIN